MSYKPKHCNECGDKIERATWNWKTSRRFCDLCETSFNHLEWMPKIALAAALFLTVVSLGLFFRKPEKSIVVSANSPQALSSNVNQNPLSPPPQDALKQITGTTSQLPSGNFATAQKSASENAAAVKPLEKTKSFVSQTSDTTSAEKIYFCGAQTKKGTPCTRRVRGGGRCWQHAGQAAMMTPEKLIVN